VEEESRAGERRRGDRRGEVREFVLSRRRKVGGACGVNSRA